MDFVRLITDSYPAQMNVYISQGSKEIHMTSDMFGLSNTKHLCRNAVLHGNDDVTASYLITQLCDGLNTSDLT
jgi:hypothetical protein